MLSYAYFYEELDPDCETVIETLSNEGKESFGGWHPATPTVEPEFLTATSFAIEVL